MGRTREPATRPACKGEVSPPALIPGLGEKGGRGNTPTPVREGGGGKESSRKRRLKRSRNVEIPGKFVHDPSKSYKFLENLGTIQGTHFATSLKCPQNPRESVTCPTKMLEIPGKFVHDPSK